jgi:hypothetical protein
VKTVYYALAESAMDAEYYAQEAFADDNPQVHTVEVTNPAAPLAPGWTNDSLVYHDDDGDIRIVDALGMI